jgi:GLPGLI family protein
MIKSSILTSAFALALCGLAWAQSAAPAENLRIEYEGYFNLRFDGGRNIVKYKGFLQSRGALSRFYMLAVNDFNADALNTQEHYDTLFQVYKDFDRGKLCFQERAFSKKAIYYSDSLHPMQWQLTGRQKWIDTIRCYSAETVFRKRHYTAWYAPSIALSNGPWKMGGLPGLIVELYDESKDLYLLLRQLQPGSDRIKINQSVWSRAMSYPTYLADGRKFRRKMIEAVRSAASTADCITCTEESEVQVNTWEKIFN